jgi:hypothetical protein
MIERVLEIIQNVVAVLFAGYLWWFISTALRADEGKQHQL